MPKNRWNASTFGRSPIRIVIWCVPVRTPGDANWIYEVRDYRRPKGNRCLLSGTATNPIDALNRAINHRGPNGMLP